MRFFVAEKPGEDPVWWFGGGFDLTPYYGFDEDAIHWHRTAAGRLRAVRRGAYHHGYKPWCDDYFYLRHRNEPRGIGGLFFDDESEGGFERSFALMRSVGDHYSRPTSPSSLAARGRRTDERERAFQRIRRGRYVEFNLVYDRGTLFGLQSGGRTESILMSLPPEVSWRYDWQPEPDSPEARLYERYLKPRDWANEA